jgi:hypothetical protein
METAVLHAFHLSAAEKRRRCGPMLAEVAGRYQLGPTADLLKELEAQ